ncbi:unnamed protein product [Peronospora effusa]|nr:unnamed protein product [Peronospora effusa]
MHLTLVLAFLAVSSLVSATVDVALTNTKGECPSLSFKCDKPIYTNGPIQAAECSHNTRTHTKQTFAVFVTDQKYFGNNGYPYGSCSAYTCKAPTSDQMVKKADCWTFFWNGNGAEKGNGTDCIRDPKTNQCGCEDSDGKFTANKNSCK